MSATTTQSWKVVQTWSFRGSKSRNKVSVGEPAEGSLTNIIQRGCSWPWKRGMCTLFCFSQLTCAPNVGCLSFGRGDLCLHTPLRVESLRMFTIRESRLLGDANL